MSAGNGGVPARRAVFRWGWRLFRREWRQQLLILGLLTVAVAATIWGAGVAQNTLPANPDYATFGAAAALVTLPGSDPHLAADIAAIQARWGPADVIENQNVATGTTASVHLQAEKTHGLYNAPMLGLVSGRYPAGPGQVALTSGVAYLYDAHTGGTWQAAGATWRVTGIVQNPSDLSDEFALVVPGQVRHPGQVIMLLGSAAAQQVISSTGGTLPGIPAAALSFPTGSASTIPPGTIVLVVAVLGLIFIGLVAVAGFSVMAQRRLRALGMLSAIGATERNVRLVMTTNGLLVGVAAALAGAVLGFAAWFAYAPVLPEDTGHVVDAANLPWWAIAAGIVLAIGTSVLASLRPAVTMARTPVVAALSGRPAAPRALRRSAGPGVIVFAAGVAFLVLAGGPSGQRRHASVLLLAGLVAVIAGIFLLAPLSATTFALFLAMLICVVTSIKAENPLDWMGPNLSSSQVIVYVQPQIGGGFVKGQTSAQLAGLGRQVDSYAAGLHAPPALPLDVTGASLFQAGTNQPGTAHFTGTLYVATPRLLAMYGIKASQIGQDTDILTEVPGLAGLPHLRMTWASSGGGPLGGGSLSCTPSNDCLLSPVIQTIPGLPGGTSAPNTLITESAVSRYHLTLSLNGWLIQAPGPLTSAQISAARQLALAYGVTVETTSGSVSLGEITDGVTALGIVIALGVLAMSVGLIRSETARDLRTLTAAGASARTRRTTISGGTLTTDMARQPLD